MNINCIIETAWENCSFSVETVLIDADICASTFTISTQIYFAKQKIKSQNAACRQHIDAEFTTCGIFVRKVQWATFPPSNLVFAVTYQVTKLLVPQ